MIGRHSGKNPDQYVAAFNGTRKTVDDFEFIKSIEIIL